MTDYLLGVDAVPCPTGPRTGRSEISSEPTTASSNKMDRAIRMQILEQMDIEDVRPCTECQLCQSRTQTVFGEGDPDAQLMFIGEGPGESEDTQGRPFVGRAGELLNKQITAMGLRREQVYIANVVKCRPPKNRAPTPAEVGACSTYLRRQIQVIQPEVIVTLGAPATKLVLDTNQGITRLRGQWSIVDRLGPDGPHFDPIPVMPTFHPAFLLRSYTPENRGRVWSDLKQVMGRLNL